MTIIEALVKLRNDLKLWVANNLRVKLDKEAAVGLKVEGAEYTIDDATVTAGEGAEVFNDYENNIASGDYSHAEGHYTDAIGNSSHAEGFSTIASGNYSHAEGDGSVASGYASHAEGGSDALGICSHAEGGNTTASGDYSHSEGGSTIARGMYSHAEGGSTEASGNFSHAEGNYVVASSNCQHVQGRYNIKDSEDRYAHIVGNGTASANGDILTYSNAHTVDWEGNAWFQGDVYVGGTSQDDGEKLVKASELASLTLADLGVDIIDDVDFPDAGNTGRIILKKVQA